MPKLERLLGLLVCAFAIALSFRITVTWIVLIAGLLVWVIWLFMRFRGNGDSKRMLAVGPLLVPIVLYVLTVTISGVGRHEPVFTVKEFFENLKTLRPLIVYFWAFDIFKRLPNLRLPATLAMLIFSSLSGFVAAVQQIFNWHPWTEKYLQGTGFMSEPMAYSGVMQVFGLIALGIFVTGGFCRFRAPFSNRYLYLLLLFGNLSGLFFSSERSAWLGFVVATIVATALLSWHTMAVAAGGLSAAAIAAWCFVPVIKTRLMPIFSGQADPGVTARLQIWRQAYTEFLKSPLTGIGTTKFPRIRIEAATEIGQDSLAHAHSNILQVLSTAGIIGLASYIWIVICSLVLAVKHMFRNTEAGSRFQSSKQRSERGLALGVFAAVLSLTVSGLAEYNFGTGQVRLVLWFVLALLSSEN